eukprot:10796347-Alexandrium_andersonii.AAC.1
MSASLVGSEMCIRDRPTGAQAQEGTRNGRSLAHDPIARPTAKTCAARSRRPSSSLASRSRRVTRSSIATTGSGAKSGSLLR